MIKDFEIAKSLLARQGEIVGITSGGSMKPLFREGKDKAVIAPLPKKLRVGDVLLYKTPKSNTVNLHRIIKITDGNPVLRGDNLYYKEKNIPHEDFIGILKGFYHNDKYYDCKSNIRYRLYVCYILTSYPLRRLFKKFDTAFKKIKALLDK